jgi:hypothetical protein
VPGLVYKLICGAVRLIPDPLALAVMRSQGRRFRKT